MITKLWIFTVALLIAIISLTFSPRASFAADTCPVESGKCADSQPSKATDAPAECVFKFTDVTADDYFYEATRWLFCGGAISGYDDGTMRPYNSTTRGQFAKIIAVALGWTIDTTGGPHFSDVLESDPFYSYIETAYHHEAIGGYDDGTFRPANAVTRGQLSKMIVLALGWSSDYVLHHFSDVPASSPYFEYVHLAYSHNIISGFADGTFHPGDPATRGQIAKIVYTAAHSER